MNKAPDETTLTLWMDGELHGDELQKIEAYAKEHPELLAERDAVQAMSRSIQENIPASVEPPYPDFFNERILHAIEAERPAEATTPAPTRGSAGIWKWLAAPLAAGAMAACFYLGTQVSSPATDAGMASTNTPAPSTVYTPDSSVESNIFVAGDQQTTVIVLEGLEDVPDDMNMAGGPIQDPNRVMVNTENYY